jgi:hypothetical protein
LHLDDRSVAKGRTGEQLYVEVPHPDDATARFPDDGKRVDDQCGRFGAATGARP